MAQFMADGEQLLGSIQTIMVGVDLDGLTRIAHIVRINGGSDGTGNGIRAAYLDLGSAGCSTAYLQQAVGAVPVGNGLVNYGQPYCRNGSISIHRDGGCLGTGDGVKAFSVCRTRRTGR